MKIPKHLISAIVAGALAATLAMEIHAQAPAPKPEAKAEAKAAPAQRTFATPEEAGAALAEAARAKDLHALLAVVGPHAKEWLFSGDKVADVNDWTKFLAAYDEKKGFERKGDTKVVLEVGNDDWPFPAPIVKHGSTWSFDADAGREEITNRRVGQNELDTIQTLLAVVDAQREYAASGVGDGRYAKRFLSTPGKKDGLYWQEEAGAAPSPLGPLIATASSEGYGKKAGGGKHEPYHGYHYRLLTSQGKDAPGGAYNYLVGDKLIGGFAVVAYPSRYGASGVMTFIVNHDGVVYQKDLGAQTSSMAESMKQFNPNASWKKAQ